jgi:ethanolamine ammonia-lyase small subunit
MNPDQNPMGDSIEHSDKPIKLGQPHDDPWVDLRKLTTARIALGRAGGSLQTRDHLDFRLAHARARDAVWSPFDPGLLTQQLESLGNDVIVLGSATADRAEYLRRPDLGRKLGKSDREKLLSEMNAKERYDLVIVISDGLSTSAVMSQTVPLVMALFPHLSRAGWKIAPLIVVKNGRVAIQDEIGEICRAEISLMLIGERPGLGSSDSLGAYFTYAPGMNKTDADRNCVSNIRQQGIIPADAAQKLFNLLNASRKLRLSGVRLKDDIVGLEESPTPEALGA